MSQRFQLETRTAIPSRPAYTLLETILALSLTMVLMTSVVTATSLYWKFQTNTTKLMTPALVLSGVLEDVSSDARAVVGTPGSSIASAFNNPDVRNSLGDNIRERVLVFGKDAQEKPIHLVGNSTSLALLRAGKNARFFREGSANTTSEHTIVWLSPEREETRLATTRNGNRIIERTISRPTGAKGLIRIDLDNANEPAHAIEEVIHAQFQYFDGTRWFREWNSFERNERLPHAIAMTLEVSGKLGQPFRSVIAIPTGTTTPIRSAVDTPTSPFSANIPSTARRSPP